MPEYCNAFLICFGVWVILSVICVKIVMKYIKRSDLREDDYHHYG